MADSQGQHCGIANNAAILCGSWFLSQMFPVQSSPLVIAWNPATYVGDLEGPPGFCLSKIWLQQPSEEWAMWQISPRVALCLFSIKISFFLKGRVMERSRDVLSMGSLPKWLRQPESIQSQTGSKDLSRSLQLCHWAGLEVEQLGLKLEPIWEAVSIGGVAWYATVLLK